MLTDDQKALVEDRANILIGELAAEFTDPAAEVGPAPDLTITNEVKAVIHALTEVTPR